MAKDDNESKGGGMFLILVATALIFIGGPLLLPALLPSVHISGVAQIILIGFGVLLLIAGSVMGAFISFYEKAGSNEAFVRTGMGGQCAVIDGGALVIPTVHKVRRVSLETNKLVVQRFSKDALITGDNLRADVRAEFYIRVNRTVEGVIAAATSLGQKSYDASAVMDLVGEKLVSAMRTVAARSKLEDLHSKLDEYKDHVKEIVERDLAPNGLFLETVAISHLNQTPPGLLDPENNVFDAQGAKQIAHIIASQRVERSKITADADRDVKTQEVERDKELFNQEVARATAEAARDVTIKNAQAEASRKAIEFAAGQEQQAELAKVAAEQAVDIARVEKAKAVQVAENTQEREVQTAQIAKEQALQTANVQKEKAIQTAGIEREQAVQVQTREQQIAVAEAEKRRAVAEAERVTAEIDRTRKEQEKLTVEKTAEAERQKSVSIIQKEATAKQISIERENDANMAAYATVTQAEGEEKAALAKANAQLTLAQANKQSKELDAAGQQAIAMVPVEVARSQVSVNAAQVEVDRKQLENQQQFERAAIDLQIELAKIASLKEIGIAQANAIGNALSAADLRIYGDPAMLQAILGSVMKGQQIGGFLEGVTETTPEGVKMLGQGMIDKIAEKLSGAAKSVFGREVSKDTIATMIKDEVAQVASDNGAKVVQIEK